jgi:hypothetical protein
MKKNKKKESVIRSLKENMFNLDLSDVSQDDVDDFLDFNSYVEDQVKSLDREVLEDGFLDYIRNAMSLFYSTDFENESAYLSIVNKIYSRGRMMHKKLRGSFDKRENR